MKVPDIPNQIAVMCITQHKELWSLLMARLKSSSFFAWVTDTLAERDGSWKARHGFCWGYLPQVGCLGCFGKCSEYNVLLTALFKAGIHAAGKQFWPREPRFRRVLLLTVVAVTGLSVLLDLERINGQ